MGAASVLPPTDLPWEAIPMPTATEASICVLQVCARWRSSGETLRNEMGSLMLPPRGGIGCAALIHHPLRAGLRQHIPADGIEDRGQFVGDKQDAVETAFRAHQAA